MPGKRLTPAEHALIVLSVRKENIPTARRLAEGYLFFVDSDDEADWLERLMLRDGLIDERVHVLPDAEIKTDEQPALFAAPGIVNEPGPEPKPFPRPFGVPVGAGRAPMNFRGGPIDFDPQSPTYDDPAMHEFARFNGDALPLGEKWWHRYVWPAYLFAGVLALAYLIWRRAR